MPAGPPPAALRGGKGREGKGREGGAGAAHGSGGRAGSGGTAGLGRARRGWGGHGRAVRGE